MIAPHWSRLVRTLPAGTVPFLLVAPLLAQGTTWHVDASAPGPGDGSAADPFPTLQQALFAPGLMPLDQVLVAPGTYPENLLLQDVPVIVQGQGPGLARVVGSGPEPTLRMLGSGADGSVLRGLSFERSEPGSLGLLEDCQVEIASSAFLGDHAGLTAVGADLTLTGVLFDQVVRPVVAQDARVRIEDSLVLPGSVCGPFGCADGGCFVVDGGAFLLRDTSVQGAGAENGGVFLVQGGAFVRVEGCLLADLFAVREGPVARVEDSTFELLASEVSDTSAGDYGGGVTLLSGDLRVEGCWIHDGDASIGWGAGVHVESGDVLLRTTRFEDLQSAEGGAVSLFGGATSVEACTFRNNRSVASIFAETGSGGALRARPGASISVTGSTFVANRAWGNTWLGNPGVGAALDAPQALVTFCSFRGNRTYDVSLSDGLATVTADLVDHCVLWGEAPHAFGDGVEPNVVRWSLVQGGWVGTGNQDADPLYWLPELGDLHLRSGSPAIDAGDPAGDLDPDGTPREPGAFPFGVDYLPPAIVYCQPKTSSLGCVPSIAAVGVASLSSPGGVTVAVEGVDSFRWGAALWDLEAAAVPLQGGTLCVGSGFVRSAATWSGQVQPGPCGGRLEVVLTGASLANLGVQAGDTVHVQFWYRDNGAAQPIGLSDALALTWAP